MAAHKRRRLHPDKLKDYATEFLRRIRQRVADRSLDADRLPGYLATATVSVASICDTYCFVFEDNAQLADDFRDYGELESDTAFLFPGLGSPARKACLPLRSGRGNLTLAAQIEGKTVIAFPSTSRICSCGEIGHHWQMLFVNLCFQPQGDEDGMPVPLACRLVPLLLYVHRSDIELRLVQDGLLNNLTGHLAQFHDSDDGRRRQDRKTQIACFQMTKERSVIVLGKDTGPSLADLKSIRDRLGTLGYSAALIKQLPDIPAMTPAQKVQLWTSASRFAIMLDVEPSGHIAEYGLLKEQQTVLALLRQKGRASTYMIGDDELVNVRFIRTFSFASSSLEVIDEAIAWAEDLVRQREQMYNATYPWRTDP